MKVSTKFTVRRPLFGLLLFPAPALRQIRYGFIGTDDVKMGTFVFMHYFR
jgi:hypothetical protein